jgi:hypothetical protein
MLSKTLIAEISNTGPFNSPKQFVNRAEPAPVLYEVCREFHHGCIANGA